MDAAMMPTNKMGKIVFIGISGVTNGGKTSLTNHLASHLAGVKCLNQDDYFREPDDSNHVMLADLNHQNWEIKESVDWDKLFSALNDILEQCTEPLNIVLIEGHIIYIDAKLRNMFDKMYFFTLDKDECFRRRSLRSYIPADPPGYFDKCIWPEYVRYKKQIEGFDVTYLDGALPQRETHKKVLQDIKKYLQLLKTNSEI